MHDELLWIEFQGIAGIAFSHPATYGDGALSGRRSAAAIRLATCPLDPVEECAMPCSSSRQWSAGDELMMKVSPDERTSRGPDIILQQPVPVIPHR